MLAQWLVEKVRVPDLWMAREDWKGEGEKFGS